VDSAWFATLPAALRERPEPLAGQVGSSANPNIAIVRHRCTHAEPSFRQSSHPSALGVTLRMVLACAHSSGIKFSRSQQQIVAGAALPCLAAAYAASMLDVNVAAATLGVALAWYGPEALLARLNRWHFSWRVPLLFVFRDLMLPVIYIDAWVTDEFVWHGNEMTMREEEPSIEQG
jgi:hypothetical protein